MNVLLVLRSAALSGDIQLRDPLKVRYGEYIHRSIRARSSPVSSTYETHHLPTTIGLLLVV